MMAEMTATMITININSTRRLSCSSTPDPHTRKMEKKKHNNICKENSSVDEEHHTPCAVIFTRVSYLDMHQIQKKLTATNQNKTDWR